MGARNSTPTTVRIDNPQRGLAVQVTPSVVSRLVGNEDEAQKKNESSKENQKEKHQQSAHNWKQTQQDPFQRRYLELEESHFEQSVEKVKSMIGKPLAWDEDVTETITHLRQGLIKCYQDHPKQALCCTNIANQYQHFIFQEQFNAIKKFNEKSEENEESKKDEKTEENKENEESEESNLPSDFPQ